MPLTTTTSIKFVLGPNSRHHHQLWRDGLAVLDLALGLGAH